MILAKDQHLIGPHSAAAAVTREITVFFLEDSWLYGQTFEDAIHPIPSFSPCQNSIFQTKVCFSSPSSSLNKESTWLPTYLIWNHLCSQRAFPICKWASLCWKLKPFPLLEATLRKRSAFLLKITLLYLNALLNTSFGFSPEKNETSFNFSLGLISITCLNCSCSCLLVFCTSLKNQIHNWNE